MAFIPELATRNAVLLVDLGLATMSVTDPWNHRTTDSNI
jgi:hypothetical protein